MSVIDVIVIGFVVLLGAAGAARGFVDQAVSLVGLTAGAVAGSRLAPELLPDGDASPWLPLAALGGAVAGALVVRAVLARLAAPLARRVVRGPLRGLDALGGAALGAALAVAVAWLVAAAALFQPGEAARAQVQRSSVLRALVAAVPPDSVLGALYRLDPRPLIPGLPLPAPPVDPGLLDLPGARDVAGSVVVVTGRSCGVPIAGSGWVARDGLVVTNVHVVAGQRSSQVHAPGRTGLRGVPVYADAQNDVAVLSVPGLDVPALPLAPASAGPRPVLIWGYPHGGPLRAGPGSVGAAATVLAAGAHGGAPRPRAVVPLRGALAPGSSGGPAIDRSGRVAAMVFGLRAGGGGVGVPVAPIERALAAPRAGVADTGPCAR